MAVNYSPEEVSFVLIDYKGGGLTGAFENKEMGINITYESGFVFEGKTTTVIEYLGSIIKPVTYVYYDENECDFIVSKLLKDFYETKEYDYVVNKDSIIIDLQTDTLLSEDTKKSIAETIKYK